MEIAGHHIPHKQLLIGGGLIAAAIAVVVWLRARAASSAGATQAAPQPDQSQGYGSMSIPAASSDQADQYQQQLSNAQLQSQTIANQYQQQLMQQQQSAFNLQQHIQEALAPSLITEQASELAVQTHINKRLADTRMACPGNAGLAVGPDGVPYCRQKTSGGVLGIPIGDISRTVQNFVGGVEAAAPTIGYQTANQAASYYLGKTFGAPQARQQAQSPRPEPTTTVQTPGIAPGSSSVHIYPETMSEV